MKYLAYARSGKEFEVAGALASDGFAVWCGVVHVKTLAPKKRRSGAPRYDIEERPALPNYLFLDLTDSQFHTVSHKYLARTMQPLSPLAVKEFEAYSARIAALGVVNEMEVGDALKISSGPLAGSAARLRAIVEGAERLKIDIEAFGGTIEAEVGILDVKKVT